MRSGASGFSDWSREERGETHGAGSWPAPSASEECYFFFLAAFLFFFLAFFLVVLFLDALRLVVRFFALLRLVAFLAFFLFTAIFTSGGSELHLTRFGQAMLGEPVGSPVCPGDG